MNNIDIDIELIINNLKHVNIDNNDEKNKLIKYILTLDYCLEYPKYFIEVTGKNIKLPIIKSKNDVRLFLQNDLITIYDIYNVGF